MKLSAILSIFVVLCMLTVVVPTALTAQQPSEPETRPVITFELTASPADVSISSDQGWDWVSLSGYDNANVPGQPFLPAEPVTILVPADATDISLEITKDERVMLGGPYAIAGVPQPVRTDMAPSNAHLSDPTISITHTLEFRDDGNMRGYRLITYMYYPMHIASDGKLELITDLEVQLSYVPGSLTPISLPKTSVFRGLIRDRVVNPDDIDKTPSLLGFTPTGKLAIKDIKYVIVTNSTKMGSTSFTTLRDWKTKKGMPAEIVEHTWITNNYAGNDTQEKIRNFIRDAVATWSADYVLLGGDTAIIPERGCWGSVWTSGGWENETDISTDLYYSDLDGNFDGDGDKLYGETVDSVDLHPDIIVGRAPVETATELTNFLNKDFAYDKNPPVNYMVNATLAGEYLDSSTNSSLGLDNIKNTVLPLRYKCSSLFDSSNGVGYNMTDTNFKNLLNAGCGLILHYGHSNYNIMGMGSPSGGTYEWLNADATALTNKYKLGVLYSAGCIAGKFDENECIAEDHVKNANGGTIAFVGNSRFGWYSPGFPGSGASDNYMKRMMTELFSNGKTRIGENVAAGKDYYVSSSGSNGANRWLQYGINLIGDPELNMRTDYTKTMTVTHPTSLYQGTQTVRVWVNDSLGSPVVGALVCLQHPTTYKYGLTGAGGYVDLVINPTTSANVNVTVTAYNYYPYEGVISGIIIDNNPPKITVNQRVYQWWNNNKGNAIDVDFDSLGETDLSAMQYAMSGSGPWYDIAKGSYPTYTANWNISSVWASMGEGNNTIYLRCNDSASHTTSEQVYVWKDSIAPSLIKGVNTYGWFTTDPGAVIDVDFTNGGAGSNLAKGQYSLLSSTGPWTDIFSAECTSYSTNWSVPWGGMGEGNKTIWVRTYDVAGNYDGTSAQVYFKKDTYKPLVTVVTGNYGWYNADPGACINVDFSNGNNGSLLDYGQYRIGTGPWTDIFTYDATVNLTNWRANWSELAQGKNNIQVRDVDLAGQISDTATIYMLKDTMAPEIVKNAATYGWYVADPGAVIDIDFSRGTFEQSNLTLAQYRVGMGAWKNIFSGNMAAYTTDWTVDWSLLVCGNNTIEVMTRDAAYNSINTSFNILKDTDKPIIDVNKATYGWYNTDPGAIIDVDFFGGIGSPLRQARYNVNNGTWQDIFNLSLTDFNLNWSVNWSLLSEGDNRINVTVSDISGQIATSYVVVQKDTEAPTIIFNKYWHGWYDADPGDIFNTDFDYSGMGSQLSRAEYSISGNDTWFTIFQYNTKTYKSNWPINWSLTTEGMNTLDVRCFDVAGNVATVNGYITVGKDTMPPLITVNVSTYGWYSAEPGAVIDVDFDAVIGSPLWFAEYKINFAGDWILAMNLSQMNFTDNWALNWSLIPDGSHNIYVRVWDQAEFCTLISSPLTFMRDTTPPPKVGLATPMDKSNINPNKNTNLTLRWNQVSDQQSGVASYRVVLDDNADLSSPLFERDMTVLSTTWELPNGNGTYYWHVRATDNCGLLGEWSNVWSIVLNSTATNRPPIAKAGSVLFGAPGKAVTFDGSKSYDPEGDSLTYEWDFDLSDGLNYKTMTSKPQYAYGTAGNYTATLKVTDTLGQFDTDTVLVAVTKDGAPINITPPPEDDDVAPDDDVVVDDDVTTDDDVIVDKNDTDSDGLPDAWEITYFSGKDLGPNDDPDGDGATNIEEYQAGTDPTKKPVVVDDDDIVQPPADDDDGYLTPRNVGIGLVTLLIVLVLIMVIIGIVVQRRKKKESEARSEKWRRDDAARRTEAQRARPPAPNYAQHNRPPEYSARPSSSYSYNQQSIYEAPKKQVDPALYEAFAAVKAQTAPMATKPSPPRASKPSGSKGAGKKQEQSRKKAPPPPPVEEEAPELEEVGEPAEELPEMEPVEEEVNWEEPEDDGDVNWEDGEDEVDFDEESKADTDDEWDNTDASDVKFDDE